MGELIQPIVLTVPHHHHGPNSFPTLDHSSIVVLTPFMQNTKPNSNGYYPCSTHGTGCDPTACPPLLLFQSAEGSSETSILQRGVESTSISFFPTMAFSSSFDGSRAALLLLSLASLSAALDVSIPLSPPSNAPTLSKRLVSISIEQDRWPEWAGTDSRNDFFYNTFDNLRALTGSPPDVRVGANSEDRTNFNPAVNYVQAVFPPPTAILAYPETTAMTVGDGFYEIAKFLLPGTHVTYGVNFGTSNLTAAYLNAQSIAKAFTSPAITSKGIVLDFVEIGNEPDLYRNNGLRGSGYTGRDYVPDWITFARNISAVAGITPSSYTKFLGGSFAGRGNGFTPREVFDAGLLDSPEGKLISTFSQHRYSGSFCTGSGALLQSLMSKPSIRGNTSVFAQDVIDVKARGLRYILGETNSLACHGAPGVSNTAGAALWAIDYVLAAAKVGIEQVFFHDGIGFKYNLIQPVTLTRSILDATPLPQPLPPHVQPQYYAAIILSEANGNAPTQLAEITVNNPQITGWAFYEGGTWKRALFVHLGAHLSSSGFRPVERLNLGFSGTGSSPRNMTIKRLAIGRADDTSGVTWGGQTYETRDGRVAGSLQVTRSPATAGFDLRASEAVLLSFS
ncbi:hypothetical protein BDV98DRAFT_561154 [Pterulicium gracile]|uniref:Beta-glucuronidase C-terminal domain-containing protein n=1 Tax=Pterulicium gracile TaxID=1884261 RepID=A0A5C3QWI4_9AGAR|nr:hypothetical protein BDV98DRAFT_561154 [Pterula gracilis]